MVLQREAELAARLHGRAGGSRTSREEEMLITCWSAKGGSGVSVVSAALAGLLAERHGRAAIMDLGGDQPAVLGLAEPSGPGVLDWCHSNAGADRLAALTREVTGDLVLIPRGEGHQFVAAGRAGELVGAAGRLAPAVVVDAGMPVRGTPDMDGRPPDEQPLGTHLRDHGSSLFVTRACYVALRRAMALRVEADGVIVLDEPGRALSAKDVSAILGIPVIGVVAADPQVSRAVDAGTLVRRIPGSLTRGLRRAG